MNCCTLAAECFEEGVTEIGNRVRFSANSVFLPDPQEIAGALCEEAELEGIIASFSDSGNSARAYAVVEVVHKRSLVVAVDDLSLVSGS